jgi:hypothetical protein
MFESGFNISHETLLKKNTCQYRLYKKQLWDMKYRKAKKQFIWI